MPDTLSDFVRLLRELEGQRFYGSIELKFEGGKVTYLRKTETMKPEDLHHRNDRGGQHDQTR